MDDARFTELAVLKGYVSSQQVRQAVEHQKEQAAPLARVMMDLRMLDSQQVKDIYQTEALSFPSVEGYKLIDRISSGKEGNVYKAVQLSMQRTVLLKVLEGERASDETAVRRFLAEARGAGQLNHPNVIRVHEVGQSGGRYFYTTEYAEGRTLEETLKQGLMIGKACEVCAQVADALDYASRTGVVHGELTPSAIIFNEEGQGKVSGLGLTRPSSTRFLLGDNCQYVAPEVAQGGTPDARSDIYSLGCILFRSITGRAPFPGQTPKEVLASHISAPVPDARASNPQLPAELVAIIARAMAKDPSGRYPSATEMASALRAVKFQKKPHLRRRRRRRRRRR